MLARVRSYIEGGDPAVKVVGVARICIGLTSLFVYLVNFSAAGEAWGPSGSIPSAMLDHPQLGRGPAFSLYWFVGTDTQFTALFLGGIVVCLWFLFAGGRVAAVLHAVLFASLVHRNVLAAHGGDKILRNVLTLFPLLVNNAYLAVGARRVRGRMTAALGWLNLTVHRFGLALIATQIMAIYLLTAFWKLTGPAWLDGTALHRAVSVSEYRFLGLPGFIEGSSVVLVALTYLVVIVQFALPIAILAGSARHVRAVTIFAAMLLHLAIGLSMGLWDFSFAVMSIDLLLLRDADIAFVRTLAGRWRATIRRGARLRARVRWQ